MSFKPFELPCEEYSTVFTKDELKRNVVVVSIIEKTSLKSASVFHTSFTDTIEEFISQVNYEEKDYRNVCQFDGHFDKEENTVYLNLTGPLNNQHLKKFLNNVEEDLKKNGFLNVWSKVKHSFAGSLLFMFSFSHIVLFISSNYSPDINIIQLLKVLSYVRPKYQAAMTKVLEKCNELSEDWISFGRLCSPRLIFLFEGCPYEISALKEKDEKISRLKKLEHSLEDQIYLALRKSRLVKNVCSRAFFSIAPNDEFVFIKAEKENENKPYLYLGDFLEEQTQSESGPDFLDYADNLEEPDTPVHSFKDFLMKHVKKAHNEGFSDNMGKYSNLKPFFEVPTLKSWFMAVNSVLSEVNNEIIDLSGANNHLEKLLGTELNFSSSRCKKVLPLAIAIYQENLPSYYSQVTHEKKVKQAISVFSHHARGPAQQRYIEQLKEECEKIWKSGRQTCEALSLNKNPCTKPKHTNTLPSSTQQG